ncbi:hypothetical protein ABT144_25780 [Streptomyces sp. NPDC002039]|uniref:hypothetical protein n=1 Tax=unclassified Streptomyces TaxID=2593676 RepID=UPI00332C064D
MTVADRREFDNAGVPALTQRLVFSVAAGHVHRDLVQSQVYLSVVDTEEPRKRAVIRLILTATAAQHDHVLGDFQEFLRSVRAGDGKAA